MTERLGRFARAGMRWIFAPLRMLMLRSAVAVSRRAKVQGFEVVNLSETKADVPLVNKISETLRLIAEVDPRQFHRLRRVTPRIVIVPTAGSQGAYWHFLRACALDAGHVLSDTTVAIGMTIVHEATHARLHQAGFRYRPALRARLEAACVKAEIAFARRIPGTEGLVANAEQALSETWWTGKSQNQRRSEQLRALGCPDWVVRISNALWGQ